MHHVCKEHRLETQNSGDTQTCVQLRCWIAMLKGTDHSGCRLELGGGSFGADELPSGFPYSEFSGLAGFLSFSVRLGLSVCLLLFVAEELVFIVVVVT
jgi:hypothetical protein